MDDSRARKRRRTVDEEKRAWKKRRIFYDEQEKEEEEHEPGQEKRKEEEEEEEEEKEENKAEEKEKEEEEQEEHHEPVPVQVRKQEKCKDKEVDTEKDGAETEEEEEEELLSPIEPPTHPSCFLPQDKMEKLAIIRVACCLELINSQFWRPLSAPESPQQKEKMERLDRYMDYHREMVVRLVPKELTLSVVSLAGEYIQKTESKRPGIVPEAMVYVDAFRKYCCHFDCLPSRTDFIMPLLWPNDTKCS